MGRYRAPQKPSSVYITPQGHKKLADELTYLWRDKRPKVTQAVSEAAAQGDRSENAEYIYGKKQLREIDWRVRFLRKRLDVLVVVDRIPDNTDKIFFGAWVELEDVNGEVCRYRIVGADEFDAGIGWISMDSPLARAIMHKQVDDEVTIELPGGLQTYLITDIRYTAFPS